MNNQQDIWHFKREELAKQIIGMFTTGISTSLVFFAPRRMGKTEFLLKDIMPEAIKQHWQTFYFSFLGTQNAKEDFTNGLLEFTHTHANYGQKAKNILQSIKKIGATTHQIGANIEFDHAKTLSSFDDLFKNLAKTGKTLLLMDEIQVLALNKNNEQFIATLRTNLDIYKDSIKVIFTGSSREGLRKMFSTASAPFFHFGQNLPFPELTKDFTDHLAKTYHTITHRQIDPSLLWDIFIKLNKIPQLIRALIERLTLQPQLTLNETKEQILTELYHDRSFSKKFEKCSALEKILLGKIANDEQELFSTATKKALAKIVGIHSLGISTIQSAIRSLLNKTLIGKSETRGKYFIDDPNFKDWLLHDD